MNVLDIPMQDNDANAKTVRDYLKALLAKLWREGEGFNGKRPFGNSSWNYEIYWALATAGAVSSKIEGDELVDVDEAAADKLIQQAISTL